MPKDEWRASRWRRRYGQLRHEKYAATDRPKKQKTSEVYTNIHFGKYKGRPLNKVPLEYLEWVLANLHIRLAARQAITIEVARRGGKHTPGSGSAWPSAPLDVDE